MSILPLYYSNFSYMEILTFLGGSEDKPPVDQLEPSTGVKKKTFIEEMDFLKKELDRTEAEISNMLDKTLYFEFQFMYLIKPLGITDKYRKQNKHFIYFFEKKMKKKLLKMVGKHESIKKKMKRLLARSVPSSRETIILQNITRPPWKK